MSQLRDTSVTAESMVRSRAWREGYESFRLGADPDFAARGRHTLAYEYGRQTAAWLSATGAPLPRVPVARPTRDDLVPRMARALTSCTARSGTDGGESR